MIIEATSIHGSYILSPEKHEDDRGHFFRSFCKEELYKAGVDISEIVQINQSFSKEKGTFRGFHYQLPPYCEEKIVTCLEGEIVDFILDLRKGSDTFLKHDKIILSGETNRSLLIPKGCAHGFVTLTENCKLVYLHTAYYKPGYERGISWSDPRIGFELPIAINEISERDKNHPLLTVDFEGIQL